MKKFLLVLLSFIFTFSIFACGNSDAPPIDKPEDTDKQSEFVSMLTDKTFSKGFVMRGLGAPIYNDPIETFGAVYDPNVYFQYEKENLETPEWNMCQWATRYPFHDVKNSSPYLENGQFNYKFSDLGNGKYRYDNTSKSLEVDTKTGEYSIGLKASECFVNGARKEKQEWPHWFIEKKIGNPKNPQIETKVSASENLELAVDVRINSFEDKMNGEANPGLHSALCLFYIFIANFNPETKMFDDMLWFGLPIFDNRYVLTSEQSFPDVGSKGSATEKWIYNVAASNFFDLNNNLYDENGDVLIGEWRTVKINVLEYIQKAFSDAQRNGYMKKSKWDNLYINGMYLGYEIPGTYDMNMSFKNLDMRSLIPVK